MNTLTVNATRMRATRRLLGMTREGLSAATDGRASARTIRKLEEGRPVMDDGVLAYSLSAALGVPYEFLMGSPYYDDYCETPPRRSNRKIPQYVAEGLRERLTYFLDKYRDLEEYVEGRARRRSDLSPELAARHGAHPAGKPLCAECIEEYARLLRERICAPQERGSGRLECVTELMESFGIKVACWPLPAGVAGLSVTYGVADDDGVPPGAAALVNRDHPVERRRFSLAQEWGHLVLPGTGNRRDDERAGNRFAGALLMPADDLREDVGAALGGPIKTTGEAFRPELLLLKARYGVSIAALLRRCHDVGLVSSDYNLICRRMGQRGWFRKEPESLWEGEEKAIGYFNLARKLAVEDLQSGIAKEFVRSVRFLETVQ